jgi:hypothetical protein
MVSSSASEVETFGMTPKCDQRPYTQALVQSMREE